MGQKCLVTTQNGRDHSPVPQKMPYLKIAPKCPKCALGSLTCSSSRFRTFSTNRKNAPCTLSQYALNTAQAKQALHAIRHQDANIHWTFLWCIC